MKLAALAVIALALPSAAISQDVQKAQAKPAKVKKVCRRAVSTGSNLLQHVCHTPEEWTQIDAANSDAAGQALDQRRNRAN